MRIRVPYSLHAPVQAQPDWPNIGFDFRPHMQRISTALSGQFMNIEFLPVLTTGTGDN
jgi:hypothetical protein